MNDPASKPKRSWFSSRFFRLAVGVFVVTLISFILFAHPFLAVTNGSTQTFSSSKAGFQAI